MAMRAPWTPPAPASRASLSPRSPGVPLLEQALQQVQQQQQQQPRHRRHTISNPNPPSLASPCDRKRRTSLGAVEGEGCRTWVTTVATAWRVAPSAESGVIAELLPGREMREIPAPRNFPGWLPIHPRGFVLLEDVEPKAAAWQDAPSPPEGPSPVVPRDAPRMALAALPVAVVPVATSPTPEEMAARRELETLRSTRDAMAREVALLRIQREEEGKRLEICREQRQEEGRRLEVCREQRGRMEEKLSMCSEAVTRTIRSLDRLHDAEDEDLLAPSNELEAAQAEALEAGAAAERALSFIIQEDEGSDEDKENDPRAAPPRPGEGSGCVKSGKRPLMALPENVPVEDFDDDSLQPICAGSPLVKLEHFLHG